VLEGADPLESVEVALELFASLVKGERRDEQA